MASSSTTPVLSTSIITRSAAPAFHTVTVGKKPDRFDPETIVANPGDLILFEFFPSNHSVIRGIYESPCIPYELYHPSDPYRALWSGWNPVPMIMPDDQMPWWNFTVTSNEQLFIYCGAPGSCNKAGMVMIINPNGTVPLEVYRQKALAAPYVLLPGQPFPADENHDPTPTIPISTVSTHASVSMTQAISTATTTSAPSLPSTETHASMPAIAGIVIGGIASIALLGLLFYFLFRHRKRSRSRRSSSVDSSSHNASDRSMVRSVVAETEQPNIPSPPSPNPYFDYPNSIMSPKPDSKSHHLGSGIPPHGHDPNSLHRHPNHQQASQEYGEMRIHPAIRETIIIPVTEEEKAMYFDRLQTLRFADHGQSNNILGSLSSPIFTNPHQTAFQEHGLGHGTVTPIDHGRSGYWNGYNGGATNPVTESYRRNDYSVGIAPVEMAAVPFTDDDDEKVEEEATITKNNDSIDANTISGTVFERRQSQQL